MRQNTPFENLIALFTIISVASLIIGAFCVFVLERKKEKQIVGGVFLFIGGIFGIIVLFLSNFAPL